MREQSGDRMYAHTQSHVRNNGQNDSMNVTYTWAMPLALDSAKTITHDGVMMVFTLWNITILLLLYIKQK